MRNYDGNGSTALWTPLALHGRYNPNRWNHCVDCGIDIGQYSKQYSSMFDKVTVRDYKQQYDYVPCASCMHPAFRKKYAIKNDIIWFEHKKQLVKSTEFATMSIPRFINSGANIEQVAELLGSANTIITNSYHGAYWGTLLKKKVIVVEAWSSKFYYLKHNPIFAPKGYFPVHELAEQCEIYPSAIDECVALNQKYFDEIRDTLK